MSVVSVDIAVPDLGESVTGATVARWLKAPGDAVARDEPVVELETDKANLEVAASAAGVLAEILVDDGRDATVGAVLGRIEEGAAAAPQGSPAPAPAAPADTPPAAGADTPAPPPLSPAVRRLVAEHDLDPAALKGSGKGGRILKGDILDALRDAPPAAREPGPAARDGGPPPSPDESANRPADASAGERRVPMSRLRKAIARRLKQAQETAAMLTTFNEVDMTAAMEARARYREPFEAKHGVRLGFMSFFVKAAAVALREQPALNARIDGDDIVYNDACHIGVAVGAPRGLVVPVLRDAGRMGFSDIERAIAGFARRAGDGTLTVEDMTGGTFTVSNGGVYGSLLSTPILNPPQSAILGMHKIEKRPVAAGDAIALRPMMYLALSYDHRIVDGREAVTFLVRVKECVEDPRRVLFDV